MIKSYYTVIVLIVFTQGVYSQVSGSLFDEIEIPPSDQIVLNGNFKIKPTDFEIDLPSFMMVKIDDVLNFEFELTFNK